MSGEMEQLGKEAEHQLFDAGLVILDICRAQIAAAAKGDETPETIIASVLSLAVQSIFMADCSDRVRPDEVEGFVAIGHAEGDARTYGLGLGVGHVVGACSNPIVAIRAYEAAQKGMRDGVAARTLHTAQGPAPTPGAEGRVMITTTVLRRALAKLEAKAQAAADAGVATTWRRDILRQIQGDDSLMADLAATLQTETR